MGVMESVGLTVGAEHPAVILAIAALLDYAIGDPWGWPHPVRVMGWAIDRYTRAVWAWGQKPFEGWIYRWAGVGLTVTLVGGSALVAWGLIAGATRLHPLLGLGGAQRDAGVLLCGAQSAGGGDRGADAPDSRRSGGGAIALGDVRGPRHRQPL